MSIEMMKVAKEYNWQCMNCKACSKCNQLSDEDMIMFCDRCDRGYHVYCVGLIEIPKGSWICDPCTQETGLGKLSSSNNTNINGITGLSFSTVTSKQKKRCPRLPPVDYSPYLTNNNKSNKISVSLSIPHFKDIKPRMEDSMSLSAKLQNQIYSQPKRHSRSGNHKRKRHR
ncbi:hypothetical protein GJ496_005777 [Pomphorhynchus laevis]|nr:hypothetical protein GJ496_005777 [Pomphorhynchus laevis]